MLRTRAIIRSGVFSGLGGSVTDQPHVIHTDFVVSYIQDDDSFPFVNYSPLGEEQALITIRLPFDVSSKDMHTAIVAAVLADATSRGFTMTADDVLALGVEKW